MTNAIRADNLSKKYLISHRPLQRNDMLREELVSLVRRFGRKDDMVQFEDFWALQGVSFEINQGERVGIIGSNGAGKSTLLKILSRITEPTTGKLTISGRVASLLEVGTGFHPELTGRENVYLNGAVLGMRREEIRRKFDEIVAFAGVDKFLDTPVKRYSSGMYIRLAFSIAAHVEPEIFIVDEVLAVGDLDFQKKCLDKMKQAADQGTTVLFVSHNTAAIETFCKTAILLETGKLVAQGDAASIILQYIGEPQQPPSDLPLAERTDRAGNGAIRFMALDLRDDRDGVVPSFQTGQRAGIVIRFAPDGRRDMTNAVFTATIENEQGATITCLSNQFAPEVVPTLPQGARELEIVIDKLPLIPGLYRINLRCSINGEEADAVRHAASFKVEQGDYFGTGRMPSGDGFGSVLTQHRFRVR